MNTLLIILLGLLILASYFIPALLLWEYLRYRHWCLKSAKGILNRLRYHEYLMFNEAFHSINALKRDLAKVNASLETIGSKQEELDQLWAASVKRFHDHVLSFSPRDVKA